MALPSSGQISFSDVRTEMSQSAKNSYAIGEWAWGKGEIYCGGYGIKYAPINVLSSGSRFSESNPLILSNLSMSAWYGYDHTAYIPVGVTGTLYPHADVNDQCYPTTMLPIELGTTNATFSIHISGSMDVAGVLIVTYGKPWNNNAVGPIPATPLQVIGTNIDTSFTYNYTYDSNIGSKIYCVLLGSCP